MIRRVRTFRFLFFRAATTGCKQLPACSTFSRAFFISSASVDSSQSSSDAGGDEESLPYKRHLRCYRPPSLPPSMLLPNTCSLIGTVVIPPRGIISKSDRISAYTFLDVEKPPTHVFSPFRIMIWTRDELARVALRYLKQNDSIYVSGRLSCYEKTGANGKTEIIQKILVADLNYVEIKAGMKLPTPEDACALGRTSGGEDPEEKYRKRLRLWQIFFASPHEWWDNRRSKLHARYPDFKHKHTGEVLWIHPCDPPWVRKQLERIDLQVASPVHFHKRHVSDHL